MKNSARHVKGTAALLVATSLIALGATTGCTEVYPSYSYAPAYEQPYAVPYGPAPYTPQSVAPVASAPAAAGQLSSQQIDQLTAPIALYPDPILAQLLPAATFPDDITNASRYLFAYPNATEDAINAQPWDASVKAIAHYPNVLKQLAGNIEWTQALGAAFVRQPQDVMDSIQHLRALAREAGSLESTPQQEVLADAGGIEILPANPQIVYVPTYDPTVVYYEPAPLYFSPCLTGFWLCNSFDWRHHHLNHHDWNRRNWNARDWNATNHHWNGGHSAHVASAPWVRDPHRPAPGFPQRVPGAPGSGVHFAGSGSRVTVPNRSLAPLLRSPTHVSPTVHSPFTARNIGPAVGNRPPIAPREPVQVIRPGPGRAPSFVPSVRAPAGAPRAGFGSMSPMMRWAPTPMPGARAMESAGPSARAMMEPRSGGTFAPGRGSDGGSDGGSRSPHR